MASRAPSLAIDPPHLIEYGLIEYGWKTKHRDGGTLRWEVSPLEDGSLLRPIHRMLKIDLAADRDLMKQVGLDPDAFPPLPRNLAG